MSKKNSHVYYDISFNNTGTTPKQAIVYDNRKLPIVDCPNNYHLSVVRFLIPTAYLPIFVWKGNNNVPDNNYFSVSLTNIATNTTSQQFLTYVPSNNLPLNDPAYLFVYSYQQFIDAVNVALALAFTAVAGPATIPPYMIFDSSTGLFSIVAGAIYADPAVYKLYFNNQLFSLFENFEAIRNVGLSLGRDNQLLIKNNGNNGFQGHPPGFPLGGINDSYEMRQEYNSTFLFNKIRSLLFVSNTVPVANESLNTSNNQSLSSTSEYRKILTDFNLNIETGSTTNTVRSYIQYIPSGEYRLIDLISDSPLYTFDVQIFFQTADLQIFPLFINPGESLNIKVLFRSKNFKSGL